MRRRENLEPIADQTKEIFNWRDEHQNEFDLPKIHLTSMPVQGYPNFHCPFDLQTDASLQRLCSVLFPRYESGKSCITAYASRPLHPNGQLMTNYSSAKLELVMLRKVVTEKLSDS